MLNLHGISRESFDLIVNEEVSGRETYDKKYTRPEKPGGQSGVTIGIGYDCGYSTADGIRRDWAGKIPNTMVEALATQAAGVKGDAAFAPCRRLQGVVSVPWEAAIDVFSNVSIPKYLAATRKGLPNYDALPPDCKGVLLSLVYNRGASFQQDGDRYAEMRAIRAAMISGNLQAIPGLLRSMKRLWTNKSVRGVALRREHEARLFEKGLAALPKQQRIAEQQVPDHEEDENDDGTLPYAEPNAAASSAPESNSSDQLINVQPVKANYSLDTEILQRKLDRLGYHEVGDADGRWGGKTKGALTALLNDRGSTIVVNGGPTPAINDIISKALAEGWTRPIAAKRANATAKDIAPKVESVRLNLWQRFSAKITAGVATLGFAGSTLSDTFDVIKDKTSGVRQFFSDIPTPLWFLIVAGVAGLTWYLTNKAAQATTKDYNVGKVN